MRMSIGYLEPLVFSSSLNAFSKNRPNLLRFALPALSSLLSAACQPQTWQSTNFMVLFLAVTMDSL